MQRKLCKYIRISTHALKKASFICGVASVDNWRGEYLRSKIIRTIDFKRN